MRRWAQLGVAVAALAAAAWLALPAAATRKVSFMFLGDSVAASLDYDQPAEAMLARGYDFHFDLRVCRRLASVGCPYQGAIPQSALDAVYTAGENVGDVLIVDVGYNDDPALYKAGMDNLILTAQALGVKRIVWVTLRESQSLDGQINAVIRSEARRFPDVEVADWNAWSEGKPWFRSDGLHLNVAGAAGLAALLRPYVVQAAADVRAGTS